MPSVRWSRPWSLAALLCALGVRRDVHYGSVEVQLRAGDRLLLLSDGIPEAPRPNGEQLGYDALQATVGKVSGDAWLDDLFNRVRAQVTAVDDDWTAVLLELGTRTED